MQYKFGAMLPKKDYRDYKLRPSKVKKHPEFYTLEPPTIKNQGNVNSCVANSVSYIIEYFNKKQENNKELFSRGFLYGYRPIGYYQGEGMYLRECLKTAQKLGDVMSKKFDGGDKEIPEIKNEVMASLDELTPTAFPNRISEYFRLNDVLTIKDAIMRYGYVIVSIPWYKGAQVK
ncbi:MAG: Tsac, partial [Clostridia bacterium]|nr:Tsac [Clostridia bacterium]